MVAAIKKLVWSDEAKVNLKAAYEFILTDSVQNAKKVTAAIVALTVNCPSTRNVMPLINTKKIMMAAIGLLRNINTGLCTVSRKMKLGFNR